jgi:hypothetical protein
MAFYVRAIKETAHWDKKYAMEIENLPFDAISNMRSSGNTLSLWKIESIDELDKVAYAFALTQFNTKKPSFIMVAIHESEIRKFAEISKEPTPSIMPYEICNEKHYDLLGLTLRHTKPLAQALCNALCDERNTFDFQFDDEKIKLREFVDVNIGVENLQNGELKKSLSK